MNEIEKYLDSGKIYYTARVEYEYSLEAWILNSPSEDDLIKILHLNSGFVHIINDSDNNFVIESFTDPDDYEYE